MSADASSLEDHLGSVLVVGGCGFLGHHIVRLLHNSHTGGQISVLDLRTSQNRLASPTSQVQYYDGDITSPDSIRPVFEKVRPDVVIHTASPTLVGADQKLMRKVNVDGTRNLLEVAGEVGVKAFVYTSSASVISDLEHDLVNATEEYPIIPKAKQKEYYTQTKADAEALVLAANRSASHPKLLTVSLRPAGLMGEGDAQLIPQMLRAMRKGQTGFQLGDNENLFDFTYVGNAAHAHILAASALLATHEISTASPAFETFETDPAARVDGEIFHITNDSPVYFWDFPRTVWRLAGDKTGSNVWVIPKDLGLFLATIFEWLFWLWGGKPNLSRREVNYACVTRYYSCEKAKRRLGYVPIIGLEEGIKRGVTWCQKKYEEDQAAERDGDKKRQ